MYPRVALVETWCHPPRVRRDDRTACDGEELERDAKTVGFLRRAIDPSIACDGISTQRGGSAPGAPPPPPRSVYCRPQASPASAPPPRSRHRSGRLPPPPYAAAPTNDHPIRRPLHLVLILPSLPPQRSAGSRRPPLSSNSGHRVSPVRSNPWATFSGDIRSSCATAAGSRSGTWPWPTLLVLLPIVVVASFGLWRGWGVLGVRRIVVIIHDSLR